MRIASVCVLCLMLAGPMPMADPEVESRPETTTAIVPDLDLDINSGSFLAHWFTETNADLLEVPPPRLQPVKVVSQTTVGRRPELRQRV